MIKILDSVILCWQGKPTKTIFWHWLSQENKTQLEIVQKDHSL